MQNQYNRDELLACAQGELFGEGNAKLPAPNMLMMDRILTITEDGGQFGKGHMLAELDIDRVFGFFGCHFPSDPVMPGCLGLDAMWQLVGFFLGWSDILGKDAHSVSAKLNLPDRFCPHPHKVTYEIDCETRHCPIISDGIRGRDRPRRWSRDLSCH